MTRDNALRLARGCHDYGGGYTDGYAEFHRGIDAAIATIAALPPDASADAILASLAPLTVDETTPRGHGAVTVCAVLRRYAEGVRDYQLAVVWAVGGTP